jgi:CheY-like chemotaxis protein
MVNNKPNILLIDKTEADIQRISKYIKDTISKSKLFVAHAYFEGINHANAEEIDLVFINLILPDVSGFKTLTQFIADQPNIPVIVLTESNNEILGNQAIKAGAQDFMVKSELNSKVIGKAIRYAIQRHTSQQKLKELSANLSADQERYLEAQKMGKFGCWEMDIVSHEMYWSDEVFKLFGFQHQSFQPTMSEYMNYVHTDDKEKVEAFFDATSKANGMINVEHRIITEGRNIKYISIQSRLVNDSRNQKIKVVGAIQDVTERKLNEKLMIEKNISRGMLNVKEQMLSDIGFQIRTPLSSITNMLFLLENMPGSSRQSELVDGLKNSFDELFGAVNNLLNYAMVGQDNLSDKEEEFKLEEFVGAFKRMALLKAGANNVKIDFNLSDSIPAKVMTYPKKLTQLFYNIANLAFTDDLESQEIDVQAGMADHQANQFELKLKGYKPDFFNPEMIALLKAEDYKTILDNVENTQNHHLLNVAILNKIIRQINGNLEINLDKDSLIMSLPVKKVEKVVVDINAKAPSSPLSVLLVEDHFLNQIATKKILTTWSSQVTVDIAENGLIGLEKHREHEYDLILMDLQMPVMNGFDSSTKIREMSDVPIIALTASASAHEETKCKAAGISAYLTKPFKPEDLHMKIMELLGSRQEG